MRLHRGIHALALFGSVSTLFCCALPALFVTLGAGATVIGIVSAVPQLVWLSQHKVGLFIVSAILLAISGAVRHATRHAPCPADPQQARACMRARRFSGHVYAGALALYAIGFFFAFIAPHLL